ncbi:MAG: DUF4286 family protein [Sphingobacteriales bacterium]|nr:DUF4286 family protein [Sphingobacteriales bacterium]
MIVYNVTTKVQHAIAADWLAWLKSEHIPELVRTGCFSHAVILHLIEADDEEGITYAVQYHAESRALYNRYMEKFAESMRKKAMDKWGDQFISFRTLMHLVN